MARNCIICGKRAGSREHVFPAALGGRRTNKGIYCGDHNGGFSPLAEVLSDQLAAINAYLSVRPDYSDKPRSFVFEGPAGNSYVVSGNDIRLARPQMVEEAVVGTSRQVTMRFADQAQVQQWLTEQRAAGNEVQISAREAGTKYFTESPRISLTFGGPEGLRAIGYVALTFFAHHFPDQAQYPRMSKFKDYVQGASEEQFVWWDTHDAMHGVPNPYPFGHTVALGVSASRGEAYARISLFSALDFAVHFGAVDAPSERTVVVHIDPQAEHPPDDISEVKENTLAFEVNRPPSLTAGLGEMIESGRAQESFQNLFNKISQWNLERTAGEVLEELNSIRERNCGEQKVRVKAIVNSQGQRVLNLMQHVVSSLKQEFQADPRMAKLVSSLPSLVSGDATSPIGLSRTAANALEIAKARLAEEIGKDLVNGSLDLGRLSMLLGGGLGAALVGHAILDPILQQLYGSNHA